MSESAPINGEANDLGAAVSSLPVRVNGGRFAVGMSGNPKGRPQGERKLLAKMYGRDGRKNFRRLEEMLVDTETPRRLKSQILMFLIERQFGKAVQAIGVEGGPSLTSLLAEMAARASVPQGDR